MYQFTGGGRLKKSVEFAWNPEEFEALLRTCPNDDSVNLSLRNVPDKSMYILEAGCGSGRVVKYLYDLGYVNVHGIELNKEAVSHINEQFPELQIVQGDILAMPYPKEMFDVVVSYGVVEHFPESVVRPMRALFDALKPGGIAVVTVPCQNTLRRFVAMFKLSYLHPKTVVRIVKRIIRGNRTTKAPLYYSYPPGGEFFEYRLTPEQFLDVCAQAGFEVLESLPIAHIDGLYHSFGALLVRFNNWKFTVSSVGQIINRMLLCYPFMHNHMHACVLRKP
jgi:SAM-dependent methyltransferase